jgi:hypothetical protein
MFKNINQLHAGFFADEAQQAIHLPKSKAVAVAAFKALSHTPKHILAINDTWMSRALGNIGLDVTLLENLNDDNQKFDTVLAMDEVLTHANSEADQKKKICEYLQYVAPSGLFLASVRDYKNTSCHKKHVGDTAVTTVDGEKWVTTEVNVFDEKNKQMWTQHMYLIRNDSYFSNLSLGQRHTLYFKQLAKYCTDNKSTSYGVLKDTIWRSPFRKQFEYLTWAKF